MSPDLRTRLEVLDEMLNEPAGVELPSKAASVLPENYRIRLALDDPIDTQTTAAGDLVSATVLENVVAREGVEFRILLRQGTHVRGLAARHS